MADEQDAKIATLVVKREETVPQNVVAKTPSGVADIVVKVLSPMRIVIIRSLRVFIQSLLGTITGAGATNAMGFTAIPHIDFKAAFWLAVFCAGVCALQNAGELLAKLDQTNPEYRG